MLAALFFLDLLLSFAVSFSINFDFKRIILSPMLSPLALKIFWLLVFPHVLSVILVGLSLGVSGAVLQIFLQNSLADPGLIGVSAGGSLFGFLGSFLFKFFDQSLNMIFYAFFSLMGVLAVMFFLLKLSMNFRVNKLGVAGIVLLGLGLNTCFSAIMSLFVVFLNQENLRALMIWGLGDFQTPSYWILLVSFVFMIFGLIFLIFNINNLDRLNFGNRAAFSMGVDLKKLKKSILISVSLLMAGAVVLAGPIGFVGLLSPHFARFFVGSRVKILLIVSGFFGAIWLLMADLLAQVLMQGRIPVGVICALLGGPVFILFLLRLGNFKSARAD